MTKIARMAPLIVIAPLMAWLIASRTLVAYFATTTPETALLLNPNDPTALIALADQAIEFDKEPTAKSLGQARLRLDAALAHAPLDVRGLRLLGLLSEREHDDARAKAAMQAAARYSAQETISVDWVMRKSYQSKDYATAAYYADILLRTHPQLFNFAMPILGLMAGDKAAKPEIDKILVANPPWRTRFFEELGGVVADARTPFGLLLALKETTAPPTSREIKSYLNFLLQHKLYKFAYFAWRQFLSVEQLASTGLLFNGGFESPPSGAPFDWTLLQPDNALVEILSRPEAPANKALLVQFGQGRVFFRGVFQTVMLPPGAYRLKGAYRGNITGRRGMQWSVRCAETNATLGESPMFLGAFQDWQGFESAFKVPDSGCEAQTVRLDLPARSSSEQLVSGQIWFDDLMIERQK